VAWRLCISEIHIFVWHRELDWDFDSTRVWARLDRCLKVGLWVPVSTREELFDGTMIARRWVQGCELHSTTGTFSWDRENSSVYLIPHRPLAFSFLWPSSRDQSL
jgi:hypothetical protein